MARKRYSLNSQDKIQYAGILILNYMIKEGVFFPVLIKGNDLHIEPILNHLRKQNLVEIRDDKFSVTEKGKKEVEQFISGYTGFLKDFEVYGAVDLKAGEFAWSSFYDFSNEAEFRDSLDDERWEDVRFAVLEYRNDKKFFKRNLLNPVELIFLSFLEEGRFDFSKLGWQSDILSGQIWDEILDISNSMLQWHDLGSEGVIKDIIKQGTQLTEELS